MIRHGAAFVCVCLSLSVSVLRAQTLQSITINGAGTGQLMTGASATLTATGHYSDGTSAPIAAHWSSTATASYPAVTVDSVTGVVTANLGTLAPVSIVATYPNSAVFASVSFTVIPQTVLYEADGNKLAAFDTTFDVKNVGLGRAGNQLAEATINYHTTVGGGNGASPIPMALSSNERYLFIGNPAYATNTEQDFVVVAIDTTTFKQIATINTGLCYPTSLAVASHYLYVVNAGPSVAAGGSAVTTSGCASTSAPNLQVYDINQVTTNPWQPVTTFLITDLQDPALGGVTGAIPLVVAASSDQTDGLVYIGSTANYNANGSGTGVISTIDVATNTVVSSMTLNSGIEANPAGYGISPLGLTVVTAYPSWNNGLPVHTVFAVGPGFSNGTSGSAFWYFSDLCQTSGCNQGKTPQILDSLAGPTIYVPVAISKSPDGKTVYGAHGIYYLDWFGSADGTSSSGFQFSKLFDTLMTGFSSGCDPNNCPITSVTSRADGAHIVVGSSGESILLDPVTLETHQTWTRLFPNPSSVLISQRPELKLNLNQKALDLSGTTFNIQGNFQSSAVQYAFQCDWGAGQIWNPGAGGASVGPTGGVLSPSPPSYDPSTNQIVSVTPSVVGDANGLPGSIINPVSVGPVTTVIGAASTTVQLGTTNQFSAQVTNATDFTIASWIIKDSTCITPGTTCPFGTVDSTGLYTAPATMPSPSTFQIWAIPNADTSDASAVSNKVTLTLLLPPTASLSSQALTFTSQSVGTTSAPQNVTLTNTGQADLVLSSTPVAIMGTNAGDFAIAAGSTCNASLSIAPSGSCSFDVTFTPSASGARAASLAVTDNSGGNAGATQTISLTGNGIVPTASLSGSSLTFNSQTVGTTSAAQQITLTNTGQASLVIAPAAVAISGTNAGDYAIASGSTCNANASVAPGSSCAINVTFTPSAAGTRTANLVVTDNSGGTANATQTVTLTGTGQAATPTATLSTASLTFSSQNVGTTSAAQQVTLTNTGQANLVLSANAIAITGGNAGDFAFAAGTTCTASLSIAPNGTCSIGITFKPSVAGTRSTTLVITDNSGGVTGAAQTVTLSGTGQAAQQSSGSLSTASLTFAAQNVGTSSPSKQVVLTNVGQANLVLASATPSISGANANDFAIANGTTCVANLSLAPNGSCVMNVTFTPSASGTRSASLLITDNTGGILGTTQFVTLTGTGQTPQPKATLSLSSFSFNSQGVGTTSAGQQVTLTNTGQANLVLSNTALSITGANPGDFVIASGTSCSANLSIAPNAACVVNVQFAPAAAGNRIATLVVTDNSDGVAGSTQLVALSGSGTVAIAGISTSSLTFNSQNLGTTSASQTVTITNIGQANLVLSVPALAITGVNASDFSIGASSTCTNSLAIAPSGSCAIQVAFSPSGLGTRAASLVISDNSGGNSASTQVVTLNGSGITPVTVTPYPSAPDIEAGGVQQFTAVFQPASGAGPVTWSVSGSGCGGHACGTINANGVYTAPTSLSAAAVDNVTVTLVVDQAVTGSAQVTLYLAPSLVSGQSQTVISGKEATYNLSLAAGSGDATKTLKVECFGETLPTGVSCQSVTIQPGASGTSFAFVVQTTGSQNAAIPAGTMFLSSIAVGLPFWTILFFRRSWRSPAARRGLILFVFLSVTACCGYLCGCGTNGSFGQPPTKSFGGTPAGSYTIQINGVGPSGIPEKIGTIGLTVQ